jgi:HSP20 family protein
MAVYKFVVRSMNPCPSFNSSLMQSYKATTSRITPQIHRAIKTATPQTRNMAFFMPRVAFTPARCHPVRRDITRDIAPLLSLFDDTVNEVARASRHSRRSFAPRFDVKEENEAYHLEGELPGIDQKDISIEFTDEHTLTIKGRLERHAESGTPPAAVVEASEKSTIQDGTATPASDDGSVKSRQPTVEDEDEAPANSSAAAESSQVADQAPAQEPAKTEAPKPQYWISERSIGQFERSFRFEARVDQDAVKASLKNGILSIVVPKAKVPESRRINIE